MKFRKVKLFMSGSYFNSVENAAIVKENDRFVILYNNENGDAVTGTTFATAGEALNWAIEFFEINGGDL